MKRVLIAAILLINFHITKAQKSITIDVEDLKPPTRKLHTSPYQSILENLIKANNSRAPNIVAKSKITDSLVGIGFHPFFEGMYTAYADHRPFTLSPDMIWLLISQGFAQHVEHNAEELRSYFVNSKEKTSLVVHNNAITLDNPNSPWQEVFPEFSKQISDYTGKELTEALTANFTTTTAITQMASQITIMDAMKSYFTFTVISIGCGIPKVTLQGTTKDWQSVLAKTEALRKYKLDWWVDAMEPVLKSIVSASQGKVDKAFWQGMFKYHSTGSCGAPTIVDGWIVKFFPYSKQGTRNDLKSIYLKDVLPDEIVKVDLTYERGDGIGDFVKTPLELWAGFVGLKQDNKTQRLTPEIGWMIRKQDDGNNAALKQKLANANSQDFGGISVTGKAIPREIFEIGPINSLEIFFTDGVNIPDDLSKIKIRDFKIHGKITESETKRIVQLLPHTRLNINGSIFNN